SSLNSQRCYFDLPDILALLLTTLAEFSDKRSIFEALSLTTSAEFSCKRIMFWILFLLDLF
ncbi:22398_t:CDS:2, partial [Gigaspora margarita]